MVISSVCVSVWSGLLYESEVGKERKKDKCGWMPQDFLPSCVDKILTFVTPLFSTYKKHVRACDRINNKGKVDTHELELA